MKIREVIGIGGEKGSGKSTVASYIEDKGYYHTYFAKNLKRTCGSVFGFSSEQMENQDLKERHFDRLLVMTKEDVFNICSRANTMYPGEITFAQAKEMWAVVEKYQGLKTGFSSVRKVLQFVGTELLRDCVNPDFHALSVKYELEGFGVEKAVISDARFANERNFIKKEWSGKTVLIKEDKGEETVETKDMHPSENSLGEDSDYDHVIINYKKSFESLYESVDNYLFF